MAGGNGKQIFGDSWWLDTEGQAPVESALSDHNLQAYLASTAKAAPRQGRLAGLQAPQFINNALSVFKDRQNPSEVCSPALPGQPVRKADAQRAV